MAKPLKLSTTKFYQFALSQPIFVITTGWYFASGIFLCLKEAKGRTCHVLAQCYWYGPDLLGPQLEFKRQAECLYPNLIITYLCNTQADTKLFLSKGLRAIFVHHNAFLDDRNYFTNSELPKIYSAVHVANVQAFKRHQLAWGVDNIAVVTYDPAEQGKCSELDSYKNLGFINRSAEGQILPLSRKDVGNIIRQSKCGLILSEKEGANFASTEYLLSGIPVVSTPSVGGRDEFFDPRHVKVVEPSAEAVERAVEEWNLNAPSAAEIRESAIEKCRVHRRRLLEFLGTITEQDVFANTDENMWSPLFVDKLTDTVAIGPKDHVPILSHPKLRWRIYKKLRSLFK